MGSPWSESIQWFREEKYADLLVLPVVNINAIDFSFVGTLLLNLFMWFVGVSLILQLIKALQTYFQAEDNHFHPIFLWLVINSSCIHRLGLSFPYVFPCSVLQATRGEFIQGTDCRFLLYAIVWCDHLDLDRVPRRDDTLRISNLCQRPLP